MTKSEQFKELLKLTTSSLTREEFVSSFRQVLDFIKKAVQDLSEKYQEVISRTEVEISSKLSSLEEKVDTKLSEVKDGYTPIKGKDYFDGLKGEPGVSPSVEEVARLSSKIALSEVQKQIPSIEAIEADLPKLGAPIRDSLELLQGDERLEIKAIKDLEERLSELKKEFGKTRFVGGGFNYGSLDIHIIDDETPTGTVNGVTTAFVLSHTPSPVSSLKVYVNGQRMRITEDFTFSGVTITFLTAPPTGSIILVDYRI